MGSMRMRRHMCSRRNGNAILEFALSFGPMIVMVFGTVDVALWYFMRSMLMHATREASRYAITYQTNYGGTGCSSQTGCIKEVIKTQALGFLNTGNIDQYVEVQYFAPDNLSDPLVSGDLPKTISGGRTIQFVNQSGNLITVRIKEYPWNLLVPLDSIPGYGKELVSHPAFKMTVSSSDSMQSLPVGVFTYPQP